jgi:hypothetical protein
MYYIYRLATSSGQPKGVEMLDARGLATIFTKDHPEVAAYLKKHPGNQCLYLEAGEGNPKHVTKEEFYWLRGCYSPLMCLNPRDVRRLLTVRTEWSRK